MPVPANGSIRTAVAIGPGTNVIDLAGPWEVFQDAAINGWSARFELFTVAEDTMVVEASGGLRLEPTYSLRHRSPAARGCRSGAASRPRARSAGFVASPVGRSRDVRLHGRVRARGDRPPRRKVCDDAPSVLRRLRGVLPGASRRSRPALRRARPRGDRRRVTAGIDLALRVVERYLGRDAADDTARYMEYER